MKWIESSGIINLYKPVGVTSTDCVNLIKHSLRCRKVGHGGTLDPFAEGVLPIGIQKGTRMLESCLKGSKSYAGVFRIGYATDTLDWEGRCTQTMARVEDPPLEDLMVRCRELEGTWEQQTPAYSARKVQGRRLYELARNDAVPETLPTREITIHSLEVTFLDFGLYQIEVDCSKGTYIRQLVQDIVSPFGVAACLEALQRTRVSGLSVDDSIRVDQLLCCAEVPKDSNLEWFWKVVS